MVSYVLRGRVQQLSFLSRRRPLFDAPAGLLKSASKMTIEDAFLVVCARFSLLATTVMFWREICLKVEGEPWSTRPVETLR